MNCPGWRDYFGSTIVSYCSAPKDDRSEFLEGWFFWYGCPSLNSIFETASLSAVIPSRAWISPGKRTFNKDLKDRVDNGWIRNFQDRREDVNWRFLSESEPTNSDFIEHQEAGHSITWTCASQCKLLGEVLPNPLRRNLLSSRAFINCISCEASIIKLWSVWLFFGNVTLSKCGLDVMKPQKNQLLEPWQNSWKYVAWFHQISVTQQSARIPWASPIPSDLLEPLSKAS